MIAAFFLGFVAAFAVSVLLTAALAWLVRRSS
jgi:hypothetical protein